MSNLKFIDIIKSPYNGFKGREGLEWSNIWIDSANIETSRRILLIGDSTIRMIRSTLANRINFPVDMIGTSSRLDDILFINLVDAFFENTIYSYDTIVIQLGHHGRTNIDGGEFNNAELYKYEGDLKALIIFLKQYSNNVIIESIFDTIIPNNIFLRKILNILPIIYDVLRIISYKEKYDDRINKITNAKSNTAKRLADKEGIFYADINNYMRKKKYFHIDHIHYENKAKHVIVNYMLKYISI